MRRLVPLLLVLSLVLPATAQRRRAVTPAAPLAVPGIDQIAAEALERVPGVSIAVRKGNAYYAAAWGKAKVETGEAMRTDTTLQIASVSKQFTAAAILKLAEEGRVRVEDPVRRFIPELDARFEPITLRHLLNHTSGVADYLALVDTPTVTQQMVLDAIMSRPPAFPAGSAWQYSNSGYYLLGIVIERASNRPYDQYLRDAFFEPLQLRETSYCGTKGPLPLGYRGSAGGFIPAEPLDMTLIYSAGGLCSSAADLVRWNRALTAGIALSPASYAAMTSQTFDAFIGARYGYGVFVDTYLSHRRIWHNGLIYGFQSHLAHYPDDDLTVVVLVNHYSLSDRATETANKVARALLEP